MSAVPPFPAVSAVSAAAHCASPGENKSRRGRDAEVPVADCSLPGASSSYAARGRKFSPAADVPVAAVPVAANVPVAADVAVAADVPVAADVRAVDTFIAPARSAAYKSCTTRDRNVSVDTDTSTHLSINGNLPTDHRPKSSKGVSSSSRSNSCSSCSSSRSEKHCKLESSRSKSVATVAKSSGGSREATDA